MPRFPTALLARNVWSMFLCELERAFEQQLGLSGIMTKGRELSLTEQQLTHDLGRTSSGHFFGCTECLVGQIKL